MNYRRHVLKFSGPLATVYACPFCPDPMRAFRVTVKKGSFETRGMGRGSGLANGSRAHSAVARHIAEEHAAVVAALEEKGKS